MPSNRLKASNFFVKIERKVLNIILTVASLILG